MKAAILTKQNSPLRIYDNIKVKKPKYGQVLVKIAYSGVCHSQLMEVRGKRGKDFFLPHLLGHEGSGKVISIGDGVKKVKVNDLVILGWIKGCGIEVGSSSYHCNDIEGNINAGSVTTFNEYALISENRVFPLPAGIPLDVAPLFGCAIPTGAGIVINDIRPFDQSEIAIFGLGGIGMSALMATQLYNCSKIIVVDPSDNKLSLAESFGATHYINPTKLDPVDQIKKITNNFGVDFSIEASGKTSVIEQAFISVKDNSGICVFASHPEYGHKIKLDPFDLIKGKKIKGSWGGNSNLDRDIPLFAKLYLDGKLPLRKLISKRYSLDEINIALDDLEKGEIGRPLIEIDKTLN